MIRIETDADACRTLWRQFSPARYANRRDRSRMRPADLFATTGRRLGWLLASVCGCVSAAELELAYTQDILRNAGGGLRSGTAYVNNVDLTYSLDLSTVSDARGTFFAYALFNNGNTFSDVFAGDIQVASNIDAGRALRLYELWYDYPVTDRVSVLVGLFDLNSEFDVIDTAGLFVNSSHGIGAEFAASGVTGPSIFPITSLAARVHWQIDDRNTLRYGVFDAVPGDPDDPSRTTVDLGQGALHVLEYTRESARLLRVGAGAWRYTSTFDRIDSAVPGDRGRGNGGAYAFADASLLRAGGRSPTLDAFVRYGIADDRFNPIARYAGAGMVLSAYSRTRPDDEIGIAVAHARASTKLRDASATAGARLQAAETAVELSWSARLTPWLRVQPNLQYIANPSFDPGLEDTWVIGLRIELATTREW